MIKSLLLLSLFVSINNSFGGNTNNLSNFETFLKALGTVESSNNPKSYNKKENAIGIYQIRLLYFKDSKQFNKNLSKYNHSDCFNEGISKLVVLSYFGRYEPKALKVGDYETLARLHNGGPNHKNKTGAAKNRLDIYWNKINKELSKK